MLPTAITDYESVQEAAWTAADLQAGYAFNFFTNTPVFGGEEWDCYVHVIDVLAAGDPIQSVVMQPLRFTVDEPASAAGRFDWWRVGTAATAGTVFAARPPLQTLASSTLLPASGSHVSAGSPNGIFVTRAISLEMCCEPHAWYTYGGWSPGTFGNAAYPRAARWQAFPRYVRLRLNGTSVGPLYDLLDYQRERNQSSPAVLPTSRVVAPLNLWFPNSDPWRFLNLAEVLDNYQLTFSAGNSFEIDIWYQIEGQREATDKKVLVSIGRYHGVDQSRVSAGSGSWSPSPASLRSWSPELSCVLTVRGLQIANGLDPSQHTYTFAPTGGIFTLGKAQAAGSLGFSITSQRLSWAIAQTIGGGTEPGDGTSSWRSDNGGPWYLIANSCTGGAVPVQPASDPPAPTDPPSLTNSAGTCELITPGQQVQITLTLTYSEEMTVLLMQVSYSAFDGDPATSRLRYYRPQSSAAYVNQVDDALEGDLHSGPTGVFAHNGATVFELWDGVQVGGYDASQPSDDYDDDFPTAITVTQVNQ